MVSLRRFLFSHTPRAVRDMTKPGYFEYAIGESIVHVAIPILTQPAVVVNLLFVVAVGMIYAPLAPLVGIGACLVFWFSSIVVSPFRAWLGDFLPFLNSTSTNCSTCTSLVPKAEGGCGMSTSTAFWCAAS